MNQEQYTELMNEIRNLSIRPRGEYSFSGNQISYGYNLRLCHYNVNVKKTLMNFRAPQEKYEYYITVSLPKGKQGLRTSGELAERVFTLLSNQEHQR